MPNFDGFPYAERRSRRDPNALGLEREADLVLQIVIPAQGLLLWSVRIHDGFVLDAVFPNRIFLWFLHRFVTTIRRTEVRPISGGARDLGIAENHGRILHQKSASKKFNFFNVQFWCVRERLDTDAELQMKTVVRMGEMLAPRPALLAALGKPAAPTDIPAFPTLAHTDRPGLDRWALTNARGEEASILHEPRLSANAFPVLRQAAIGGVGIAILPEYACRELLEDGRLVRILPEWAARQGILHLVFTSRRGLLPSVRAVIDFAAEVLHPRSAAWETAT
jgi:hypothetical protein